MFIHSGIILTEKLRTTKEKPDAITIVGIVFGVSYLVFRGIDDSPNNNDINDLLCEMAERHHQLMRSAPQPEERHVEDGHVQAMIELYMRLNDVDCLTAEEQVHPACKPGDNDSYQDDSGGDA